MLDWNEVSRRRGISAGVTILSGLALLAPLRPAERPETTVGLFLLTAAFLEWLHGQRRATAAARFAAWRESTVTLGMGALLLLAPLLSGNALVVFLAASFASEGLRHLYRLWRRPDGARHTRRLTTALLDLAAGGGMLFLLNANAAITWTVAIAGALRLFDTARRIATAPVSSADLFGDELIQNLRLLDVPELKSLGDELEVEASLRAPIDRGWVLAFLATLYAIHAGRMGTGFTLGGVLAPAAAVLGDIVIAVLFTMGLALPVHLLLQRVSHPLERRAWRWWLAHQPWSDGSSSPPPSPSSPPARSRPARSLAPAARWVRHQGHRAVRGALVSRLRSEMQWQVARYSIPGALGRGVRLGLPFAAIVAATVPVWGMSWYFDTENWAAGLYNSWAESRTDNWREAMVRAVDEQAPAPAGTPTPFSVSPGPLGGAFSFIVIGDTGEGDASQHVLRDRLLGVANRDDVRFVVISSDVVYPAGAMKDYEAKFWLPFKGVTKPVFAIPGNHDWYDALEGFNATFLTPPAARAAIAARVDADLNISTTTQTRIDQLIGEAARLRREYGVPTGFQRAPYFDIQTDDFALLCIDTGVVKRIDDRQQAWLDQALAAASGKMTMAILGHPFFAGGHDEKIGVQDFERLYAQLDAHGVTMVMAGDTHDLEYYREPAREDGRHGIHHVVNGGGGAYLSFGSALAWPASPALSTWAYYPSTAAAMDKIDQATPWWKRPAWWWTRDVGAWPFSTEWLSAAFDSNTAPFFQSFVEVRVEPDRLLVRPYGVHGRLQWSDLSASPDARPPGAAADDFVEWAADRRRVAAAGSTP